MVYMFLKEHKKEPDVESYTINNRDGLIKLEFHEHVKAQSFYKEMNFKEKILLRPLNIYLNLKLSEK